MKSGKTLSIFGVLGGCNESKLTNDIRNNVNRIMSRIVENRCAVSNNLKADNVITYHAGEIVLHRMRYGNVVFPLLPRDLESNILGNCLSIDVRCC